jgi:hypothetical protein
LLPVLDCHLNLGSLIDTLGQSPPGNLSERLQFGAVPEVHRFTSGIRLSENKGVSKCQSVRAPEHLIDIAKNAAESTRLASGKRSPRVPEFQEHGREATVLRLQLIGAYRGDASRAAFTRSVIHSFTSDSSQADDILEILIGLGKVGSV